MEIILDSPTFPLQPLPSREAAIAIARSWLGTPYVLGGRVKQAGCDCATLIVEYAIECGFVEREDLGIYSHDWFHNTSEDRYKYGIIRHAQKTIEGVCRGTVDAKPGCFILFKVAGSRVYNHGGIVTQWPNMIHSVTPKVVETDATRNCMTSFVKMCIFDPWDKPC